MSDISNWSIKDLRDFVIRNILTDPGALPPAEDKPLLELSDKSMARRVDMGSATLSWPGLGSLATVTVTHRLGKVPSAVFAIATLTSTSIAVGAYVNGALTDRTIPLGGFAQTGTPAAGVTATIYWIALG